MDELHPGPPYKSGGPLQIARFSTDELKPGAPVSLFSFITRYDINHMVRFMPSEYLGYSSLSDYMANSGDDEVSQYGAAGWNKFRPTRSGADLGTFLGEAHEIPRMLKTTAKGFANLWRSMGGSLSGFTPKKLANHWLNHQFGWLPFLSDLRGLYKTTKTLDKRLKQLRRDNGRWIRRGGTISMETDSEEVLNYQATPGLSPALTSSFYATPYGSAVVTRTIERHYWFEGAFRYWIPGKPNSWQWNARAVAMLYGAYPSPSLLWELTPWSWLIDWWADVGDAIANLSSIWFDNLCAKYSYVMGKTRRIATSVGMSNYASSPVTMTRTAFFETKARAAGSPFGFGLTGGDFTSRQWSILGSLGLTRLR